MNSQSIIYLDNHATTRVDPRVASKMLYYLTEGYGNASSSQHIFGHLAAQAVESAREKVASLVDADPRNVIFTSGATEGINLAILGFCRSRSKAKRCRVALTTVEHPAVLETCRALEAQRDAELIWISVDSQGRIDLSEVEKICAAGTDLLCVMAANNEIGNIYPTSEIGQIAEKHGVYFLIDGCQAVGRIPIAFASSGAQFLILSAHKMYGPKGLGALVIRERSLIQSTTFGGAQEDRIRPGTLNVPGIVGFGEACVLRRQEMSIDEALIANRRDRLQNTLIDSIANIQISGDIANRPSGSLHLTIDGIEAEAIIARTRDRLAISTGSACSSGAIGISHVLRAMGMKERRADGALRLCVGKFNSDEDVSRAGLILSECARQISESM